MKYDFMKMMREADLFSNKIIELSTKTDEIDYFNGPRLEPELLIGSILEKGMQMAKEMGSRKYSEN